MLLQRLGDVDEDEHAAVEAIAAHVDGIPLAIELAAARCRTLGVREVASRLTRRVGLLADHLRATERHRVLEDVIRWSYETLDPASRIVFQRLSVFAAPFPLASAEQVCADDELPADTVDDAVSVLVDRSLLTTSGRRFRLLEPVRQFAGALFVEQGGADSVRERYLDDTIARVETIHDGLLTPAEARWVEELDLIWPDVRQAVRMACGRGDTDREVVLVTRIANEAFFRRPEAFAWIADAGVRHRDHSGPHRAALLGAAAQVAWTTLDLALALELADEALRAAGDRREVPFDLLPQNGALGALNFSQRYNEAIDVAESALERYGALLDPSTRTQMAGSGLISRAMAGQPDVAVRCRAALASTPPGASPSSVALMWFALCLAALTAGDADEAAYAVDRAHALAEPVRNEWLLAMCTNTLLPARDPLGRVAQLLDGMDDALRAGWITHAWTAGWLLQQNLVELGERPLAAVWLGACEASGIPLIGQLSRPVVDVRVGAGDDPELRALVETGRTLPYAELRRRTLSLIDAWHDARDDRHHAE
jgi:hypothetical protein